MTRIRLRARRGHRADAVEVPAADLLLGSGPDCGVLIEGAAPQHAWLLPRRGRLLLRPVPHATRRPILNGARLEAPVVLGPSPTFALGDATLTVSLTDGPPGLSGATVGGWAVGREIGSPSLGQRIYEAVGAHGHARVHLLPEAPPAEWAARFAASVRTVVRGGATVWTQAGPPGITLDALMAAQRARAIAWPAEAGIVLTTQLAEAVCDFHAQLGGHGALRPELVFVDVAGRVSLLVPGPRCVDLDYQPEAVRLGARADQDSDAFGWWRLAHQVLASLAPEIPLSDVLPRPPADRRELLLAAEGVRRWAIDRGWDPTSVHVARGIRLAREASPVARANLG